VSNPLISSTSEARSEHLSLPEFAAFNFGRTFPQMRRWELPFSLFAARLDNTAPVLDCTINPAGFGERLVELYPHVSYWSQPAIRNGCFALPQGIPDASFERVFCVNTLEHLLAGQRAALVAAIARKLKPGGWLVLTGDYYFNSFWFESILLRSKLLRADRGDVFNGFNQVRHQDWEALARANSLLPLHPGATPSDPDEQDPGLYRNAAPYPHATISRVFVKDQPVVAKQKRVLLALLSWNTHSITKESLHAYILEAEMLERLGVLPFICVCDNGSQDGTAQELRRLETGLRVPHRFIYNAENRGNCTARNQIIDYARNLEADYLLFMDGDIEIVPFSSFAMMRYLEGHGSSVGCVGADSAGHAASREQTTPYLYTLRSFRVQATNLVAWTQYGMFRREVFDAGVRFDEQPPFNGPGWGFEDNDLAFQIAVRGFENHRFFGMVYLHRSAHSSIRNLRRQAIDVRGLCEQRKQYVLRKWKSTELIRQGPLQYVEQLRLRI
jgi:SAM-dependent methyltransferase